MLLLRASVNLGVDCSPPNDRRLCSPPPSSCRSHTSATTAAAASPSPPTLASPAPPALQRRDNLQSRARALEPPKPTRPALQLAAGEITAAQQGAHNTTSPAMGFFSRRNASNNRAATHDSSPDHRHSTFALNGNPTKYNMSKNPAATASLPHIPIPRAPDPNLDPAGYLRSIYAVRERSHLVLEKAKKNQLRHFNVDMSKFQDTANYVVSIIKV